MERPLTPPHPGGRRPRPMPLVLARLGRPERAAAAVYAHLLIGSRIAEVPETGRMRVQGGHVAGGPPRGGQGAMLAELEAAIGGAEVSLGRPRGGRVVMVSDRWLVRRVAVDWWSQAELLRHLGLAEKGERGRVVAGRVGDALGRMALCRAMAIFD